MRQYKETFILRYDFFPQIKLLSTERRGVLLTAIFAYSTGEPMPEMDDMTRMCFGFIRASLDANAEKYATICGHNRENGSRGGRPSRKAGRAAATASAAGCSAAANASPEPADCPPAPANRPLTPEPNVSEGFQPEPTAKTGNPIDVDVDVDVDSDSESESETETESVSVFESGPGPAEKTEFLKILLFEKRMLDPLAELDRFWTHYEKTGWVDVHGNPIRSRRAALRAWAPPKEAPRVPLRTAAIWREVFDAAAGAAGIAGAAGTPGLGDTTGAAGTAGSQGAKGRANACCLPLLAHFRGLYAEGLTLHILAADRGLMDCMEHPLRLPAIRRVLNAHFREQTNLNYRIAKS